MTELDVPSAARTNRKRRFLGALAVTGAMTVGSLGLTGLTQAGASTTADLSITQAVANSTVNGQTNVTITVHNAGPAAVSVANFNDFITTTSGGVSAGFSGPSGSTCEITPRPAAYALLVSCQQPSIASGASAVFHATYGGTAGVAFKNQLYVGALGLADSNQANNTSTLSTYYGARADLKVTQTATVGAKGKLTIVGAVHNFGPTTANALQLITEIKSPGFTSVGASSNTSSSCQFIPPATGYNAAVSCTTNSLAPGKSWVVTYAFHGTAGGAITQKATTSANGPADPATGNNTSTISSHYGS